MLLIYLSIYGVAISWNNDMLTYIFLQINIARPVAELCSVRVIYQDWDWAQINKEDLSFDYSRFQTSPFSLGATARINLPPPTPIPLNWKADHPVWIELLLLLLSHFSHVRLCATPWTAAYQAPPSLGLSRQEHWSGLPFPSSVHESEK